jgi:hypothetical protein
MTIMSKLLIAGAFGVALGVSAPVGVAQAGPVGLMTSEFTGASSAPIVKAYWYCRRPPVRRCCYTPPRPRPCCYY